MYERCASKALMNVASPTSDHVDCHRALHDSTAGEASRDGRPERWPIDEAWPEAAIQRSPTVIHAKRFDRRTLDGGASDDDSRPAALDQ
jgi:hypothetical protein